MSYSPKLPLQINPDTNNFLAIESAVENAKQNIKMILLTSPGEKINNTEFGIGVMRILFEDPLKFQNSAIGTAELMRDNLQRQLYKYNPEINLDDLELMFENNYMYIKVLFSYLGFSSNELTININLSGI